MKNYSRSQSLANPQNYMTCGKNPILICLLDQMKQDQELSNKFPNHTALLDATIAALETGRISWQNTFNFNLMSSEQWIQKMRADPEFYFHHARNSTEMREYEYLLLDLASQCLKRKIQLIPFLEQEDGLTFKPTKTFVTNKPTFYILSCQNLMYENFFISIQII